MGEKAGHPFRGNQHGKSKGSGGGGTIDNDARRLRNRETRIYAAGQKGETPQSRATLEAIARVKEEVRAKTAQSRLERFQDNRNMMGRKEYDIARIAEKRGETGTIVARRGADVNRPGSPYGQDTYTRNEKTGREYGPGEYDERMAKAKALKAKRAERLQQLPRMPLTGAIDYSKVTFGELDRRGLPDAGGTTMKNYKPGRTAAQESSYAKELKQKAAAYLKDRELMEAAKPGRTNAQAALLTEHLRKQRSRSKKRK